MNLQKQLLIRQDVDQTEDSFIVADMIKKRDIKCFVEIGVSNGGSLAFYSYVLPKDCIIVGIDNREIIKEEKFNIDAPNCNRKYLINSDYYDIIKGNCDNVHLIKGNSHDVETYDKLIDIIGQKYIDFLHIDGDHTYEGVSDDFNTYYDLVVDDGIIVIHDIHSEEGVARFWKDIKFREFKTTEIEMPPLYTNIGIVFKE